ncbi:hypothetical protein Ahy_B03g067278 isoform B [Arachis hypogaea]|uniref:Ribosomal RNA-processing protein 14 N-terminal domain-containing protein n=1 Tax=Arachis hypogaea TaxID=3818 RepID=A0A445A6E0_ARAHY|nr:hypothetical protein Ahy_B03g067278 isoform B [Arachis hypogaea]
MRKKKQKSVAETDTVQDLDSVIQDHTLFFDKLIELIPAKFYLPDDKDKPWFQGLSKAKKAEAKRETKENIKKSRRERLDPENPPAATLDLLKQNLGSKEKAKKDAAETSNELVFGHVKLTDGEMQNKKRRLSKHKELERAKKLEEEKNDPEKGEAAAKKQLWKAAMDRASGIKVHDDPKLLEKSIRKEKKKQQKNAEKWKERIQTRDQLKAEKQQKRSNNISERIHHQKMRKIAKREKKLLRPGFEGRKEGFITEGSS